MIDLGIGNPMFGPVGTPMVRFRDGTVRDAAAFRARIEDFKRHVEERQHMLFKRVIADALTGLVNANPVDTGHSRRNWQVVLQPFAAVTPGADTRLAEMGNQAAVDGYAAIAAIPLSTKRAFLVNPVPYMERLNQGWSKQAPAGWIDQVFQRVLAHYRSAK